MPSVRKFAALAVGFLLCVLGNVSFGQLFPNAPWNKQAAAVADDGCLNGQCPLVQKAVVVATVPLRAAQNVASAVRPSYPAVSSTVTYGSSGSAVSGYGSSGSSLGRDYDGAAITSVGPSIAPPLPESASVMDIDAQALRIGDRVQFRRALIDAARQARDAGEITSLELFMLSAASRSPRVLEKMQAAVHEAAIAEGLATAQEIDWTGLVAFIEKLIPIIIKLIDLFGSVTPEQSIISDGPQYAAFSPHRSLFESIDYSTAA